MRKSDTVKLAALLSLGAIALSACGGGGGHADVQASAPATVPSLESQFGTGFNTAFYASTTSTPAVPMAGDIIALDLTATPVQLH